MKELAERDDVRDMFDMIGMGIEMHSLVIAS